MVTNVEMPESYNTVASTSTKKRFGCLQVFGLMVITVIIAAGATFFILKAYLFPSGFQPVTLNAAEEKVLAEKLGNLNQTEGRITPRRDKAPKNRSESGPLESQTPLEPEPFSEQGLKREVSLTERELNGLVAKNTDLAQKLAIDLSDDLISAKLLLPVDEDFPILGGKVLRLRSGMVFSFKNGKPVVILKGVTVMGVPVPNVWLGGIKNIDLVDKFGTGDGFWNTFSDGVEDIKVEEGLLKLKLKE